MSKREVYELYIGLVILLVAFMTVLVAGRYASGDCLSALVAIFMGVYLLVRLSGHER